MENKYYTPNIEDVRIGYECEHTTHMSAFELNDTNRIIKDKLYLPDVVSYLSWVMEDGEELSKFVRTPYLTKEQIEAEGWEMYSKGIDMWFEKEVLTAEFDWSGLCNLYGYKPYKLFLNYGEHDHKINIKCDFSGGADFSKSDTLFEGYCPSINEFRYISKLLKIK